MKNTVLTLQQAKNENRKITMLTAYDYSTARLIDEAGVNMILVGDSLGNVGDVKLKGRLGERLDAMVERHVIDGETPSLHCGI